MDYVLAQVNVGRIRGPIDSAVMKDFVDGLDEVNALAESSPGFVWRLQTEEGDATALRPFDDDLLLINMSSWESLEALHAFVYGTLHATFLRRRREWFERLSEAYSTLWWQPRALPPRTEDAVERLSSLRANGPTIFAFTFATPFTRPASGVSQAPLAACPR